jgi:hypothetical protein
MSVRACILLLSGTLVWSGCASTRFERDLHAQRWSDAVRMFDADSTLQTNERAMFRVALLRSAPEKETYDPSLARELFERLLRRDPTPAVRESALRHLAVLNEMQRIETEAALREQATKAELDRLQDEVEQMRRHVTALEGRLRGEEDANALLRRIVDRLETDLSSREAELHLLRSELDRLKEIDFRRPQRPSDHDTTTAIRTPR